MSFDKAYYEEALWFTFSEQCAMEMMKREFDNTRIYKKWVSKCYSEGMTTEIAAKIIERAFNIYYNDKRRKKEKKNTKS